MRAALFVAIMCACGCGPDVRSYTRDNGVVIHHFPLSISNAWAIEAPDGLALIDFGTKDDADDVLACLAKIGKKASDVNVVVATHGHFDHSGSAKALKASIDAPFLLGGADIVFAKNGVSEPGPSLRIEGDLLRPLLDVHFPPWEPDVLVEGGERLDAFGIPAQIIGAPGHTAGSIAVVLDGGDAFVGDMVAGTDEGKLHLDDGSDEGHMGRADTHLYSEDVGADAEHLDEILGLGARRFYPGHGPWFAEASLRGWVFDHLPH